MSEPLLIEPPMSVRTFVVWEKPPKSKMPPATVILPVVLRASFRPSCSVPALIWVRPL